MFVAIGGWCIHVRCIAHQSGAGQVAQQLDNAIFRHMGSLVNLLQLNVINLAGKCMTASVIALMQRWGGSCFPDRCMPPLLTVCKSRQPMPPRTEVLGDEPIRGQRALGVPGGRESLRPPRNLVRHIVEHPILPVRGPVGKVCWVLAPHGMPEKAWNRVYTLVMKGAARSRWLA
jgi:hypothetical protein